MTDNEYSGKIKVAKSYKELSTIALASFAKSTKFAGDVAATAPPHDDTAIYGWADTMFNTHNGRVLNPSKTATSLERQQRNTLEDGLDANVNYLETVANAVAKTAGDINAGIAVVTRIGFQLAAKGTHARNIGVIDAGIGWFHAHEAKSVEGNQSHLWEGGITNAKGTPPTDTKLYVTCESDVIFNNIPSVSIYAYHHAGVVPVSKDESSTPQSSMTEKTATLTPQSKNKHPVIDINNNNLYQWGEWRYVVIP